MPWYSGLTAIPEVKTGSRYLGASDDQFLQINHFSIGRFSGSRLAVVRAAADLVGHLIAGSVDREHHTIRRRLGQDPGRSDV